MFWEDLQTKSQRQFKRLTGVKRSTFEKMVTIVEQYVLQKRRHATKGKPPKRTPEDKVLMLLMYYREYRTFLHTATTYGYSESQGQRIIRTLEEILIRSKEFRLPGKKALLYLREERFAADVGESPIERPKKSSGAIIPVKRSGTPIKSS